MKCITSGWGNSVKIGILMEINSRLMKQVFLFLFFIMLSQLTFAQTKDDQGPFYIANDSMMMTVIIKHQQQAPVDSIQARIMKQRFYGKLDKSHVSILSWNVVMGIGQIITLKFKSNYIREINQVFESGAWGGFTTEFYPTYDFLPVYPQMLEKENKLNKK